ncbi:glycosyltransferase family 4 protein [Neorhizobium sp. NCHU2750]|uniref:glycosyltransferase family 4 protein n=1 Tax=Neorhizobium sp. NCHU2750 TaxID=1825976 RepID=UPI000E739DA6|nr:glycosyltransferase [Neorhizobium sp. NCHU2750]
MKILFYSPLKSPSHAVPSGDRLMARLLLRVFESLGHEVVVASEMRSFMRTPDMDAFLQENKAEAEREISRLITEHSGISAPGLWFTYHPYYKAPDLIGPSVARHFGIPLINAEASYSHRRNIGTWKLSQDMVLETVMAAAVNLCFTERDESGLRDVMPNARLTRIAPFIDCTPYLSFSPSPEPARLVTVAMMRPGNKLANYRALAESLGLIAHLPWTLTIAGDGECREEVRAAFEPLGTKRIEWLGGLPQQEIGQVLDGRSIFLWPGINEAYGLSYLEAQACGLPVMAEANAGVPEVVEHNRTGLLTPFGDRTAYAEAIVHLMNDDALRTRLGQQARTFVVEERSIAGAARRLDTIFNTYVR